MKLISVLVLVAELLSGRSLGAEAGTAREADLQAALKTANDALSAGRIARVEVYYLPTNVLTRVRVSPKWLDENFEYKLIISHIPGWKKIPSLAATLKEMRPASTSMQPDLRWACVLYEANGKRLLELYLDGSGTNGVIQGHTVLVNDVMHKWLVSNTAGCFD